MNKDEIEARVIEASVCLFSSRGYHGTSTREIARLADVNENSMFRHFRRKEDLFWAAVESQLKQAQIDVALQSALAEGAVPETVVPLILDFMVRTTTERPELVRLLSVGFLELRAGAESVYREHLTPICRAINGYLAGSIECGKLRAFDPALVSAGFLITAIVHHGLYQLLTGREAPYCGAEEAVAAYSQFWLEALAP